MLSYNSLPSAPRLISCFHDWTGTGSGGGTSLPARWARPATSEHLPLQLNSSSASMSIPATPTPQQACYCSGNFSSRSLGSSLRCPGSSCGSSCPSTLLPSRDLCSSSCYLWGPSLRRGCKVTCWGPSSCQMFRCGPRDPHTGQPLQDPSPWGSGLGVQQQLLPGL